MSQAMQTPLPVGASIVPGSLRAEMESRRGSGGSFTVKETMSIIVPLCVRLAELHAQGQSLYVHPSALGLTPDGRVTVDPAQAATPPVLPRDRACLAPEERKGGAGDARASVFAVGAILYELLTNANIGPGMRRPGELVAGLPPSLETILGKALVADPKHRPGDLAALAQALHHVSPNASIAPPPADESHLDGDADFEVDVRLSMIPPNERPDAGPAIPRAAALPQIQGDGPYGYINAKPNGAARNPADPTQRLADMKAALESDPRPRYVVIKNGMDHGPFSAVEALQQIASGQFTSDNVLRDTFTNDERFIKDWEEFAPFAEQAKLNRDIVKEKKQLEAVVVAEKQGTQYKALIGAAVIGVFAAGAAGLWLRDRATKDREREVQENKGLSVDVDGGLAAKKGPGGAGGPYAGGGVGPGGHPMLSGGMSCEGARAKYIEDYDKASPPDLSAGAYGNVLNKGSYLNSCGVPSNMTVSICAAVQNGRAVGVTVTTNPSDKGKSSCIAGAIRGLSFPSHPRLDVTTTTFAAN